jgi:hypothetical protein
VKTGKTMVGRAAARALVILPEAPATCDNRRQKNPALGFTCFAAQWPRAQRSLSSDLIFGLLFYQEKSNSLSGN